MKINQTFTLRAGTECAIISLTHRGNGRHTEFEPPKPHKVRKDVAAIVIGFGPTGQPIASVDTQGRDVVVLLPHPTLPAASITTPAPATLAEKQLAAIRFFFDQCQRAEDPLAAKLIEAYEAGRPLEDVAGTPHQLYSVSHRWLLAVGDARPGSGRVWGSRDTMEEKWSLAVHTKFWRSMCDVRRAANDAITAERIAKEMATPGRWLCKVESATFAGTFYEVQMASDGTGLKCSCLGYSIRQKCRHLERADVAAFQAAAKILRQAGHSNASLEALWDEARGATESLGAASARFARLAAEAINGV